MDNQIVDTDSLSLEQLRELALGTAVPPTEQPRDDAGRFTAPVEDIPTVDETEVEQTEEEQPQEFVRTIDLGDGSGVQVFRGATAEEVADKLVEAQRHASTKIRADHQRMKVLQEKLDAFEAQRSAAPLTDDERYLLSQKFAADPIAAQTEILERMGLSPKVLKQAVENQRAQETMNNNIAVFQQWISAHPDFADTTSNGEKIGRYLQTFHGGIATTEAIDHAYKTLKADGLLQDKTTPTPTPTVRRTSGISSRRSVAPPPPPTEDLYEMPLEKLREKANGGKAYGGW